MHHILNSEEGFGRWEKAPYKKPPFFGLTPEKGGFLNGSFL
jgi:hypothetical protein